jgi:polysaccharide biosynthesis transport protein
MSESEPVSRLGKQTTMNTEIISQNERSAVLLQNGNVLADSRFVEDDERAGLRSYQRVFRKYKRLIVTFFFGAIAATAIATLVMMPIYTAETTVLIEPNNPDIVNIKQVVLPESLALQDYDYYKTQFQILKSRGLIAQVIQEQRLDKNPLFTNGLQRRGRIPELWNRWIARPIGYLESKATAAVKNLFNWLFVGQVARKSNEKSTTGVSPQLIDAYQGMLKIEPVAGTRLVKIAFSSADPDFAATVANAHAQAYIRQGLKLRSKVSEEAQKFLETKLAELRKRVEASEAVLNQYRRGKGLLFLNDKEDIVVGRLADLSKRVTEAEAERIGLEAQAHLIQKREYDSLPAVISNSLIQTLKAQVVQLEAEHARLAAQFLPGYPRLAQVAAQLKEAKSRLAAQISNVVQGIHSAYAAAAGKEKELRAEMDKQKSETLEMKDAAVQYAILAREADTNNQLYNSVLARLKEVGVAGEIPASNVSVIDSATAPERPSWPRKTRNLLLGAIVGLMGGLGLALISDYFDNTLKTPRDVEGYLRLPNLAVVPDFFSLPALGNGNQRISRQQLSFNSKLCVSSRELTQRGRPLTMLSEAYRKLRTSIFLSRPTEPPKTILFTSATNGEGKTITVANTAIMLAQMEMQVLVVDADLRKPSCHKAFRVGGGRGLTDYLAGQEQLVNAIKPTSVPNVSLLNCGSMPSNPTELVGSKRMQETLGDLKGRYDFILIDAPPVMPVSDAVILSTMVDGVVLVVRGQKTEKQLVKEALSQLGTDSGKMLGVVLNRVDIRGGDYTGYKQYYYPHFYAPEGSSET